MIYIHKLDQLSPKLADIEVVPIIREIKLKIKIPLAKEEIIHTFTPYFVQEQDISTLEHSLEVVTLALQELKKLYDEKNPLYEQVNIARAMKMIQEIPGPLQQNLLYAKFLSQNKNLVLDEIFTILTSLPHCTTFEEKTALNHKISVLLTSLLRSDGFRFNCTDLVTEVHTSRIQDLSTMLADGLLFHIKIDEELNKVGFETIQLRIPKDRLLISERIRSQILEIKKGVDKAYKTNMLTIQFVLLLYSYIKVLKQ